VKSSSVSPDGMLGGRGYVMNVKDVRGRLQDACELLSAITDTLYDEINAPHWKPKMADLGENEAEDITELVDEAGQVIADPEAYGEKEIEEIESRNDGKGGAKQEDEPGSKVPETGGNETTPAAPHGTSGHNSNNVKQASSVDPALVWKSPKANSSVPVTTLSGPRVDHLDRADQQTGPGGSYNKDEEPVGNIPDGWQSGPREGDYTSVFAADNSIEGLAAQLEHDISGKMDYHDYVVARSGVPDANSDPTETNANDFGVGFGAKGEGSEGYGAKAPDGRGVAGPSSELPNDPGRKTRDDEEGSNPYLDGLDRNLWATSGLPQSGPPARSDYYDGDKGNQFNVSVHGTSELLLGESGLPGSNPSNYNYDRDTPDFGSDYEQQDVPYVKWDRNVHDYRNDTEDLYQHDNKVNPNG